MQIKLVGYKHNILLALGAESAGNFSIFDAGKIFFSADFGDLLEEKNWKKYRTSVLKYLRDNKIKPQIILADLHPLYKTTTFGKELAEKFNAKLIQIQHHHAHIFSAIGDRMINFKSYKLKAKSYCITMDGTGLGTDEKIWGGEVFEIKIQDTRLPARQARYKIQKISRIGHLENQIMISGDLAVREPARMLIGVLSNLLSNKEIYPFVKKYYNKNQFELIYNQLQQNFNCLETSSTGRILDSISLLLGFCGNKRNYKHEPIDLLEKNSTLPYSNLKPKIIFNNKEKRYILSSSHLFKYLLKNIKKDESLPADEAGRLASTAQLYIAEGLYEIIKLSCHPERSPYSDEVEGSTKYYNQPNYNADSSTSPSTRCTRSGFAQNDIFVSGGIVNTKIISEYLISKGAYASKIIPRGDAGLSFGQIIYYLLKK